MPIFFFVVFSVFILFRYIDEVRIWAYELQSDNLDVIMFTPDSVNASDPALIAYWSFDDPESNNTFVKDLTGNGNDLFLMHNGTRITKTVAISVK